MSGVLLLGGSGFLGSALARQLVRHGYEVHILSPNALIQNSDTRITIHRGYLDDEALLEEILPTCGTVFHLASATTPGNSAQQPYIEAQKNILPTLKFLDLLQRYQHVRLIFVSSGGTLYGDPEILPVAENHPLRPRSYHGAGKVAIEAFFGSYASHSGRNVTILRPSNLYGPGQSLRSGFGVIRTMLAHLRQGTPMEIWGDGETVRDFLYIDDMVAVCSRLLESPPEDMIYNIGSGVGQSINQIKSVAESVSGKKLKVIYKPIRHVDIKKVVLDIAKIKTDTGWQPEVELTEGVRLTWEWVCRQ